MAQPSLRLILSDEEMRLRFKALHVPSDLAELLEVPYKTLCFYLYKKQNYTNFAITKKSGESRLITTPHTPLKIIQKKLSQVLYAVYGSRAPVHGFARGRSVKTNASKHLGASWILNFDLKDFFPSIHFGRIVGLFSKSPYGLPLEVSKLIAQICCHNAALPVGAPTSPIVANMVCAHLDSRLKTLAWSASCTYTRYADDMTFSTREPTFRDSVVTRSGPLRSWVLSAQIVQLIENQSFKVNPYKTHVRSKHSSQEVTGVRINSGLNVAKPLYQQVRTLLRVWENHGEQIAQEVLWKRPPVNKKNKKPKLRDVLRGKIEFIGFIRGRDHAMYVKLLQRFLTVAAPAKAESIAVTRATHESIIRQAIWLLQDKNENVQGTAFAVEGGILITAAHNLNDFMFASRPSFGDKKFLVTELFRDSDRDIACLRIETLPPVHFKFTGSNPITLGSSVCVVGFPHYHIGDSVAFREGRVVQERRYFNIPHYIVDADIVKGNSGGPILDEHNRVIGVAVKGLGIPGAWSDDDQLSSFIPVQRVLFPTL